LRFVRTLSAMINTNTERAYWEQRLGSNVPLNAVGYRGLSNAFVAWSYRVKARRFQKYAAQLVTTNSRILDVGSGGGFAIDNWQRLGMRDITGSDFTDASVSALNGRFPGVSCVRMDISEQELPFAEGSFDAISCIDVLYHIVDDDRYAAAFRNFGRLLKPGGHLIFTENFLHAGTMRGAQLHGVFRSLGVIQSLARDAGLKLKSRRPLFVLMNIPMDSSNPLLRFYWKAMNRLMKNPVLGYVAGALLYPVELLATSLLREGPSTEIAVAQKIEAP